MSEELRKETATLLEVLGLTVGEDGEILDCFGIPTGAYFEEMLY